MGLGLTLVDGNLNGIKGVYVKSVIEGGAGMNGVSSRFIPIIVMQIFPKKIVIFFEN